MSQAAAGCGSVSSRHQRSDDTAEVVIENVVRFGAGDAHSTFLSFCSPAGLSSFQESVAVDRIQRIMGVLQNPNMG